MRGSLARSSPGDDPDADRHLQGGAGGVLGHAQQPSLVVLQVSRLCSFPRQRLILERDPQPPAPYPVLNLPCAPRPNNHSHYGGYTHMGGRIYDAQLISDCTWMAVGFSQLVQTFWHVYISVSGWSRYSRRRVIRGLISLRLIIRGLFEDPPNPERTGRRASDAQRRSS